MNENKGTSLPSLEVRQSEELKTPLLAAKTRTRSHFNARHGSSISHRNNSHQIPKPFAICFAHHSFRSSLSSLSSVIAGDTG